MRTRHRSLRLLGVALSVGIGLAGCSSSSEQGTDTSVTSASTTTEPATTTTPPVLGPVVRTGQQELPPLYAQGVARIPNGWIFTGNNSIWKTDNALKEITHTGPSIPPTLAAQGFNHIGDVDVNGDYIYAPLEQPDYSKGRQLMARFEVATLKFVDAVPVAQHHNSFVTIDPDTMIAYTTDEFDDDALLRFDVTNAWKPLPPLPMSKLLHRIQGGDIYGGAIWISTDDAQRAVYRVDMKTGAVTTVATLGHPGGEGEGIDATELASGFLHVQCVDAKYVPVWFEHFRA